MEEIEPSGSALKGFRPRHSPLLSRTWPGARFVYAKPPLLLRAPSGARLSGPLHPLVTAIANSHSTTLKPAPHWLPLRCQGYPPRRAGAVPRDMTLARRPGRPALPAAASSARGAFVAAAATGCSPAGRLGSATPRAPGGLVGRPIPQVEPGGFARAGRSPRPPGPGDRRPCPCCRRPRRSSVEVFHRVESRQQPTSVGRRWDQDLIRRLSSRLSLHAFAGPLVPPPRPFHPNACKRRQSITDPASIRSPRWQRRSVRDHQQLPAHDDLRRTMAPQGRSRQIPIAGQLLAALPRVPSSEALGRRPFTGPIARARRHPNPSRGPSFSTRYRAPRPFSGAGSVVTARVEGVGEFGIVEYSAPAPIEPIAVA